MGLLARIKAWLARHTLLIEFCHRCGREQPLVWTASDELWSRVSGELNGGGVLCPECFDDAARRKGLLLRWTPTIDSEWATVPLPAAEPPPLRLAHAHRSAS